MKLLFDQNISFRVIQKIAHVYDSALQVVELGLQNNTDISIWEYAKENDFTIVTFDSDFYDIANIKGHPPKIIWLRIGNTRTEGIAQTLIKKSEHIFEFITKPEFTDIACLEIK